MSAARLLRRAGAAIGALALVAAAGAAPAAAVGSADPTGDGSVSVRVTLDGKPLDTPVTLHASQGNGEEFTKKSDTDARGHVTFSKLPSGKPWTYTATALSSGVTFTTDRFELSAGDDVVQVLPTFATTTSSDQVVQDTWTVWVDMAGSSMAVQQDVAITNKGKDAYIGSTEVQGGTDKNRAAVELPLAPNASNLQYLGRFETCCAVVSSSSWANTRPVNPGSSTGTLRYEAPPVPTLSFPAKLATTAFSLLVPAGTVVTSGSLKADGQSTDKGVTYDVYRGTKALAVGDTVEVALELPGTSSGSTWPWVAAGAVALLALIGLGWWLLRGRRQDVAPAPVPSPAVKPKGKSKVAAPAAAKPAPSSKPAAAKPAPVKAAAPVAPRPEAPAGSSAAEVQVLADELAMLDLAWEHGTLTDEASYRRVRESIVNRMMAAMKAGDAVSP